MDFLRKKLPTNIGRYLNGVDFPIHKRELISRLERNGVPGFVLDQVRKRLPDREYRGPQDVIEAVRKGRGS